MNKLGLIAAASGLALALMAGPALAGHDNDGVCQTLVFPPDGGAPVNDVLGFDDAACVDSEGVDLVNGASEFLVDTAGVEVVDSGGTPVNDSLSVTANGNLVVDFNP